MANSSLAYFVHQHIKALALIVGLRHVHSNSSDTTRKEVMNLSKTVFVGILIVMLATLGSLAHADAPITLTDIMGPNTVVNIDPYTQAGIYEWLVDGTNHMRQNSYWFSVGSGPITPISSLGSITVTPIMDMMCSVLYSGSLFDMEISYMLMGAPLGSGQSDIAQIVSINNKTGSVLDFSLYEFVNLDLNGKSLGQSGTLPNSSTLSQTEGTTESQWSAIEIPSIIEVGDAATLLAKLNNSTPFVANSNYEGDVAAVFQWNMALGDSAMMSQDNALFNGAVPEPASMTVFAALFGLVPLMRRRII